jgi:hypothetical protein
LGYFRKTTFLLGGVKMYFTNYYGISNPTKDRKFNEVINECRSKLDQVDFASAWMDGYNSKVDEIIKSILDKTYK